MNVPDYGESPIQVQYEWSPTLYSLTDGEHSAYVLLEPAEYLSADGEIVYQVYGQYTDALSNTSVEASLYFDAEATSSMPMASRMKMRMGQHPVEITPQIVDQFTD